MKKEIKIEKFKFLELNENKNTACQNLWNTIKAVLRGRFIATTQINNFIIHLKALEK